MVDLASTDGKSCAIRLEESIRSMVDRSLRAASTQGPTMILSPIILSSLAAVSIFINSALCQQKRLQKVVGFGVNPTRLEMFIYVPTKVVTKPPIIIMVSKSRSRSARPVANVHSCTPAWARHSHIWASHANISHMRIKKDLS
jgi:hypothetical protein